MSSATGWSRAAAGARAAPSVHPDAVARAFREREAQRQAEAMRQIGEQKKLIAEAARNKTVAKQIAKQVQQQEQQQAAAQAAAQAKAPAPQAPAPVAKAAPAIVP